MTLNLDEKDETSIISFISNLKIDIYNPNISLDDELYDVKTYDEIKKTGKEILSSIKYKLLNKSHKVVNKLVEKISNSYLAKKIKIYELNKAYSRINEGVELNHEKSR